jgi:hypothetical protein
MDGLSVFLWLVIGLLVLIVRDLAAKQGSAERKAENLEKLNSDLTVNLEQSNSKLAKLEANERLLGDVKLAIEESRKSLEQLQATIAISDSLLELREPVIYPRRFPEETSEQLKARMSEIKERQSEIRKKGQVVINFGAITQQKMTAEERAKLKALVKLARLALEGAADTLLDQVKASNQARLDTKFKAVVGDLDRQLKPWGFQIGKNYQATVRDSLELMSEYQQQIEKEREEQRALREQMREEAAAQREAERAQRDAEADERRAERDLVKAREAAEKATEEERSKWTDKVQQLEAMLAEAHAAKDRAKAMAQLTKAGHVYVISNIGSFGEAVFKIGMTRRLDPYDRVAELGDASVPFPFDIHGMIRSDDAPALEYSLHSALDGQRMNLVNERKEFFRVPLFQIREAAKSLGHDVQLTEVAEASEYRQSESMRRGVKFDPTPMTDEVGAEEPE